MKYHWVGDIIDICIFDIRNCLAERLNALLLKTETVKRAWLQDCDAEIYVEMCLASVTLKY